MSREAQVRFCEGLGGKLPGATQHLCITDGVFTKDGDYYTPWDWKPEELKEKLRRRILKAFVRWEKLTPEAADVVACWDLGKCGFSLFIGSPIGANERERLARLLWYLMRSPVSFKRLKYDESTRNRGFGPPGFAAVEQVVGAGGICPLSSS